MGTILTAERFGDGLTEAQKRQLFDEHITWYRMYGMSMRPVPETWEDFQAYWDHMCREVLEELLSGKESIPRELLDKAECVAVVPSAKKFALGLGGRYGKGAVACRSGGPEPCRRGRRAA